MDLLRREVKTCTSQHIWLWDPASVRVRKDALASLLQDMQINEIDGGRDSFVNYRSVTVAFS